ncbi:MAG: M6 family metalloprotease domain-containing protein [Proteobacteria bacterium]|nr:M6 family metalloprotease domain-containing protein [Pseudomonadota bacterium]
MKNSIIKGLILSFLVFSFPAPARALPPPDPRFPEAGIGFELNYLKSHAAAVGLKGFFPEAIIQPQGSYNLLVIMMSFSDVAFSADAQAYFSDLYFGNGGSGAYAGRSFVLFFEDMAAGQFRFNRPGEQNGSSELFLCPDTATGTHSDYGKGGIPQAHQGPEFAKEAVICAHNKGGPNLSSLDLSKFDNNGDGVAESIIVIHPGYGEEQCQQKSGCGDIWSHSVELDNFIVDGVGIKYAMGPEKDQVLGKSGIGVFAHEYCHVWGVPDLYDPNLEQSRGLGFYDLMAYGLYLNPPVYLSAWPRHKLGWLKEKPADANLCPAELSPVETSGEGYLLYPNRAPGNEYFLATFNTAEGNDELLPARGLLIWHVDENKWAGEAYGTPNDEPCYPATSTDCCTQHFLVALEQADAAYNLEIPGSYPIASASHPCPSSTGYYCDSLDYWNGGASFNENTAPASQTYCGGGSGISLDNIKVDPSNPGRLLFSLTVDPGTNPIIAPMITSIPGVEAPMAEPYRYQLAAQGNPPLEYRLRDYPTGVSVESGTGLLTWVPNDTQIGVNHLKVEAENCRGTDAQEWDVTVTYAPPTGEEKSQGCGCNSLEGFGSLPLGMIGFYWLRRSRRAGR